MPTASTAPAAASATLLLLVVIASSVGGTAAAADGGARGRGAAAAEMGCGRRRDTSFPPAATTTMRTTETRRGAGRDALGAPLAWRQQKTAEPIPSALLAVALRGGALGRRREGEKKKKAGGRAGRATTANTAAVTAETPASATPSRWFPIRPAEVPHFAALSTLMFLFIYVFTTVRDTKDTLVVSHCGAEAIPVLKLYGVMPAAALFIVAYGKASSVLGRDALFHATLLPFFVFYGVFGFVLYPLRETIHFPLADSAAAGAAGAGAIGVGGGMANQALSLLRYWSYSLYFIVSELWASAGVPLLFWQAANDVTPLNDAKRFYPLFAVFGNMAPILSGRVMSYVVGRNSDDDVGFGKTLKVLASIKVGICAAILVLYRYVYGLAERRDREMEMVRVNEEGNKARKGDWIEVDVTLNAPKTTKKKKKSTLAESMKELSRSPALRSMATMVLCYNICIELTEVLWKGLLRNAYPTKSSYMAFMATFSQKVGYVAVILQLCASAIIRNCGWHWSALITPLAMVLLALPFFGAVALGEERGVPLATALMIGTAQNVVSKVTKYSLFDPCKEMAYIPLGPDAKVRGKAAVDVLGARLGRSVGSASQQLLVFSMGGGSITRCAASLGVLYAATIGVWTRAVSVLAGVFDDEGEGEDDASSSGGAGKDVKARTGRAGRSKKKL